MVVARLFAAALLATLLLAACGGSMTPSPVGSATAGSSSKRLQEISDRSLKPLCPPERSDTADCLALLRTDIPAEPTVPKYGYGPDQLQSAYRLPSATRGKDQTVAIVDAYDNPSVEQELGRYRLHYHLPACSTDNGCFLKLNQEGQQKNYPAVDKSWGVEEDLDVEMVSAICPNCRIVLLEANSDAVHDLSATEHTAAGTGAHVISNSWTCDPFVRYGCVISESDFAYPGIVITAAAGDSGFNSGDSYPAAFGSVVAVGGTALQRAPSSQRGWSETVWDGTGSGCTTQSKPPWQRDVRCQFRTANDVAAAAGLPGVAVFSMSEGGWVALLGTSVSTQIIAAVYGLAGNAARVQAARSLYANEKSGLFDVTSGSNGDCSPFPAYWCTAKKGYDGPSGTGTPNGIKAF